MLEKKKNFFIRHKILSIILIIIIIGIIKAAGSGSDQPKKVGENTADNSSKKQTISSTQKVTKPTVKQRQIAGKSVDLGAGTFLGGKDVKIGLYDVTPVEGQGNFTINGSSGDLKINEILGTSEGIGVSKVRVIVKDGDKIQLQGINKAHFAPVTTPFIKSVKQVSLYSGVWTVGEDIAAGRYKSIPINGNGNFIIYDKIGMLKVNEVLGGDISGVKEVTIDIKNGDIINIANLNQVNIVPVN